MPDKKARATERASQMAQQRPIVGLASNPAKVLFKCGHCDFFDNETCYNEEPQLHGRTVHADWCCDFFKHPGMRVIVK